VNAQRAVRARPAPLSLGLFNVKDWYKSRCSVRGPPRSRVDLDRGCHAGDQADAVRYLIDPDAHWHPVGKPYPREDRVNVGKPLIVWLCVRDIDVPRDAGDLASHNRAVTHQFDLRRIALVDGGELRFLEIGIHPEVPDRPGWRRCAELKD
jgi:hypothetical protein